jgi:hypothetical protein
MKLGRPRKELAAFAQIMEAKLQENSHKGTWKGANLPYILGRLLEECAEIIEKLSAKESDAKEALIVSRYYLRDAASILIESRRFDFDVEVDCEPPEEHEDIVELHDEVSLEAADVANFAFMISDIIQSRKKRALALKAKKAKA